MEDQSIFSSSQPKAISEGLQNFINAMVEEIVLEGKPFDTQKKYLRKFSENEGLDYETIEKGITELVETFCEMKSTDSKLLMKLALIQAKEACVTEAEVLRIVEQMGEKENGAHSAIDFNVNGVSFVMVKVGGGTFSMGATPEQGGDTYDDEKPAHSVTVSTFYMGETEVTQALWKAVMGSEPTYDGGWEDKYGRGNNYPAYRVSWNECQEFIRKLNQLTGKNFRLPTEAEWEFAARGGNKGNGTKYAGSNSIGSVAWYEGNSGSKPHAVKGKSPNELGLYDMSGNVWEWCSDWYGGNYYSGSPSSNPKGPSSGSSRVLRGGSWFDDAGCCRVSFRRYYGPSDGGNLCGFRLALP